MAKNKAAVLGTGQTKYVAKRKDVSMNGLVREAIDRALDLALVSCAFSCWPRKLGRAIAARMPMIRITMRSSMSVKPSSSRMEACTVPSLGAVVCGLAVRPDDEGASCSKSRVGMAFKLGERVTRADA